MYVCVQVHTLPRATATAVITTATAIRTATAAAATLLLLLLLYITYNCILSVSVCVDMGRGAHGTHGTHGTHETKAAVAEGGRKVAGGRPRARASCGALGFIVVLWWPASCVSTAKTNPVRRLHCGDHYHCHSCSCCRRHCIYAGMAVALAVVVVAVAVACA